MPPKPRYLTKSAFQTASECPTKLSYLKKSDYPSTKQDNAFLRALADGGFQVGELAKLYYPGGIHIDTLDYTEALTRTNDLLQNPNVILYEAAFLFQNCFIRTDILIKNGNQVKLIEVKAKSVDKTPSIDNSDGKSHEKSNAQFWTKKHDKLNSEWKPYLFDLAYQKWVLSQSKPNFIITPYLILANKAAAAEVEGMNQKFSLISHPDDSNLRVTVEPGTTKESLGSPVLSTIRVESEIDFILTQNYDGRTFDSHIQYLSDHYSKDERIPPELSRECRNCEYRISEDKIEKGFKSGFNQCWIEAGSLTSQDLERPIALDIWKLHSTKKDAFLEDRRYFMDQLDCSDLEPKTHAKLNPDIDPEPGLSTLERQCLQIEFAQHQDTEPHLDLKELSAVFATFTYPLHFIDFETTRVAIPFHRGRKPYEQIAFQFSHHLVHQDGRIEHKDQHLCFERGKFPNYDFVRALKVALETDQGTIFRYADHENTVLREIHTQLRSEHPAPHDAEELCRWIDSVTRVKTLDRNYQEGSRCMVDLKMLVQKFFYHPATHGSNSIKAVLPAILNESKHLQVQYSKAIYGASGGIPSLNFKDHTWIHLKEDGTVHDPYKSLDPVFTDLTIPETSLYQEEDRINEGGAAMTAYGRMQFTQMSDSERERVAAALLRYCELDTFAMVLIYEYWKHELSKSDMKEQTTR